MSIFYRRTITADEALKLWADPKRLPNAEYEREYRAAIERLNRTTDREINEQGVLPSYINTLA